MLWGLLTGDLMKLDLQNSLEADYSELLDKAGEEDMAPGVSRQ